MPKPLPCEECPEVPSGDCEEHCEALHNAQAASKNQRRTEDEFSTYMGRKEENYGDDPSVPA